MDALEQKFVCNSAEIDPLGPNIMITWRYGGIFGMIDALSAERTDYHEGGNPHIWCVLCCKPGQAVAQTVEWSVIWEYIIGTWRRCNVTQPSTAG